MPNNWNFPAPSGVQLAVNNWANATGTGINPTEWLQNANPSEVRSVLNEVNKPPKDPNLFEINDKYAYRVHAFYEGNIRVHHYEITQKIDDGESVVGVFKVMQYPKCCGISILHDFMWYINNAEMTEEILEHILTEKRMLFAPFIQFVAVRTAIVEYQEYNEEEDEKPEPEVVGHETEHAFEEFIKALVRVTNAEKINQFVNPNSDNICEIWQFRRLTL